MTALQSEKSKYYRGKSIVEYVRYVQKHLSCGIPRSAIVENLNSWGPGGEAEFQYALDSGLIIPSGQKFMYEPGYIVNPEKFSESDFAKDYAIRPINQSGMAALRYKGSKNYRGKSIVDYVREKQRRLPCGISRYDIVESLSSRDPGVAEEFQHALDTGLIIPSGQDYMLEPGYVLNPEKFPESYTI